MRSRRFQRVGGNVRFYHNFQRTAVTHPHGRRMVKGGNKKRGLPFGQTVENRTVMTQISTTNKGHAERLCEP